VEAFFAGEIDEVDIFNRALTASEIQAIFNAGSTGKSQLPSLSISDVSVMPGASGTTNATFNVDVARPNSNPVTVDYATLDSTAVAPRDYTAVSGTLTIPANAASATITVPVLGGTNSVSSSSFFVSLSNPTNAIINNAYATGRILTGNAVDDCSATTNDANQTWQYGYSATDGTGFTNFANTFSLASADSGGGQGLVWHASSIGDAGLVFNPTGHLFHYNIGTYQPTDELGLFPNNDGRKCIVRWKAPAAGTYQVTGRFEGIESAGGATTSDATIVLNGNTANPLLFNSGDSTGVNYIDGYQTTKIFSFPVTVNVGDTIDFRLGWGDNNQYSFDGTGLAASISKVSGGGGNALPAIATVSKSGPATPGGTIMFSATTTAGVNVRVQSSTTPDDEGSWTDLPDGNGAKMTEDSQNPGNYSLDTTAYPFVNGVYFRFISSKNGFTDGKSDSHGLGPYDLRLIIQFSETGPANAGDPIHFTATTATGWKVRVQSTTDQNNEGSWADLADGGQMTEDANNPGSYSLDSAAYPDGSAIYFRAIASKTNQTDLKAVPLGPLALHEAALTIFATAVTESDPVNGHFAHIGDTITYIFHWKNAGDAPAKHLHVATPVPTYIDATSNLTVQFTPNAVNFSQFGQYIAPTSSSSNDAQIVWDVADLDISASQTVNLVMHLGPAVRLNQAIGLGNGYQVYSSTFQPPAGAFGARGTNVVTNIDGAISFTLVPTSTTVAPGGLMTYSFRLGHRAAGSYNQLHTGRQQHGRLRGE
jgi:uncharacterized repeat protein (TIGR01451 family)